MIVEIFGPPAAGKTTLAHGLARRLRERGLAVDLALSYRPSEPGGRNGAVGAHRPAIVRVARRLTRPTIETLMAARLCIGSSPETMMADALLAPMPPVSTLWAIRLRQYIWRLTRTWRDALTGGRIVIFDQGYVQTLCSLALLCAPEHAERLPLAFRAIPQADVLVRLDPPYETVRHRLLQREREQGSLERMFELDVNTNLRSIGIFGRLETMLREHGAIVTCIRSGDKPSGDTVMTQVERAAGA